MKRLSCTLIAAAMLLVSASAIPILDKSNGSLNGNQASLTRNARRATRMQSALASDDVVTSDSDDSDQTTRNKSKWMDEIEDADRELRESINLIINSNSDNDSGKDTEDRQAVKSDTLMDENSGSNTEHEPTNPSTRQLFEMANAGQEELPQHSTANSALVVKDGKRPVSRIIQHVEKGIRLMGPYRRSRNDKKRHGSQDSAVTDATITANHVVKPSSPSDNAAFGPFIEQQMTTMSSDTSTSSNNVVKDETSNVSPLLNDDDDQNADELPDNDRQPIAASTNSLPTDVSIEPSAKPNNQLVSAKDKSNKKDSNNNSSNNNKAAPLVWTVVKHTAESASTDNEQSLSLANDRITEEPRMATDVKTSPQTTVDPSLSTPPTATLSTNAADINLSKLNTNNSNNNNNKNVATPSPPATAPTAPLNTGFIVSGQPQMGMMPSNGAMSVASPKTTTQPISHLNTMTQELSPTMPPFTPSMPNMPPFTPSMPSMPPFTPSMPNMPPFTPSMPNMPPFTLSMPNMQGPFNNMFGQSYLNTMPQELSPTMPPFTPSMPNMPPFTPSMPTMPPFTPSMPSMPSMQGPFNNMFGQSHLNTMTQELTPTMPPFTPSMLSMQGPFNNMPSQHNMVDPSLFSMPPRFNPFMPNPMAGPLFNSPISDSTHWNDDAGFNMNMADIDSDDADSFADSFADSDDDLSLNVLNDADADDDDDMY